MTSQFVVIDKFFWRCHVALVKSMVQVSCQYHEWFWSYDKFRDWSEIPKSEIPLSALRPISWNWRELGIPNALKCQGYNFYRFWVIKRKPAGEKNYPGSTICFYFFIVCILAAHSFEFGYSLIMVKLLVSTAYWGVVLILTFSFWCLLKEIRER